MAAPDPLAGKIHDRFDLLRFQVHDGPTRDLFDKLRRDVERLIDGAGHGIPASAGVKYIDLSVILVCVGIAPSEHAGAEPSRISELESSLAALADQHHRTLTGSSLHDPERTEDFRECPAKSCQAAAKSLQPQEESHADD